MLNIKKLLKQFNISYIEEDGEIKIAEEIDTKKLLNILKLAKEKNI
jgi:hypothetical protein